MSRDRDERYFQVLQGFLLVVALLPMLCCGGCLGLGMLTAFRTPRPMTRPVPPTRREPARKQPEGTPGQGTPARGVIPSRG